MEHILKNIEELRERVAKTMHLLQIDRKEARAVELRTLTGAADFWSDHAKAVEVSKEAEALEFEAGEWRSLEREIRDLEELVAEGARENDVSVAELAQEQLKALTARYESLEFYVLFNGKYDEYGAILSIHAGTGGVDAQDWAEMLLRMFLRFAERRGFGVEVIDRNTGNEAGLKSVTLSIRGRYAYGYLKSESGVHRLVRISPFDAEAMRHTSFALVEVIPELPEAAAIEIRDEEIEVGLFRSSGPGGQNVNKVESAVRIKHLPTGIIVASQSERSQHQNRELAMRVLRAKLAALEADKRSAEERGLKGEAQKAEWGKQIRSYVLQPYQLVKDHRTEHETGDTVAVLEGKLEEFMEAYLRHKLE